MPSAPHLEGYLYDGLAGLRSLRLSEDGGSTWYRLTITGTKLVTSALAEWQTLANTHGSLAGSYVFGWNDVAQNITFARTDGAPDAFDLDLEGSLYEALGFSAQTHASAASYVNDLTPGVIGKPVNIEYQAPIPIEDIEAREFRGGRPSFYVHQLAAVTELTVSLEAAMADAMIAAGLFASRFRAWPYGAGGTAYGVGSLRSYFDAQPYNVSPAEGYGLGDAFVDVRVAAVLEQL